MTTCTCSDDARLEEQRPAAQSIDVEELDPFVLCEAPRGDEPESPRVLRRVTSTPLREATDDTRRAYIQTRLAAPGIRRGTAGTNGRSYLRLTLALGSDPCLPALAAAIRAQLGAGAHDDPVYYSNVMPLRDTSIDKIREAFDTQVEIADAESDALEALAEEIRAALSRDSLLLPYLVQAGWADAVGSAYHGVALVDPQSREAVWTFAEEVWNEE